MPKKKERQKFRPHIELILAYKFSSAFAASNESSRIIYFAELRCTNNERSFYKFELRLLGQHESGI